MAIPALDMQKPKTTIAGTATHMLSVALTTAAANAPAREVARTTGVRLGAWAR